MAYATRHIELSLAQSLADVIQLQREQVEVYSSFEFLGIIVMDNQLKPTTKDIIKELNDAKFRSIIATGDNIFTAISVGKKCEILRQG